MSFPSHIPVRFNAHYCRGGVGLARFLQANALYSSHSSHRTKSGTPKPLDWRQSHNLSCSYCSSVV